ncbi:MAG: hypothetical protein IT331_03230 [Anaerolineae bacterium]|nr:hypothetical protein [Anaerolineae bacterium]
MTKLLERAFVEASKLDASEQDTLARWILEELESERRWDRFFADSQDELILMAQEALEEHRKGLTKPLDPDTL